MFGANENIVFGIHTAGNPGISLFEDESSPIGNWKWRRWIISTNNQFQIVSNNKASVTATEDAIALATGDTQVRFTRIIYVNTNPFNFVSS